MAMNYPYYSPNNYSYMTQQQTRVEQPFIGIKGRPVSSIEEVRATSIDFDGSIFYFPDLANKKIYTKQVNIDGTSTLNVYELKDEPIQAMPNYVTKEELDTALEELKKNLAKPIIQPAPQEKFEF